MRAADLVLRVRRRHYGWLMVGITFLATGITIGTSNYAFGLFVEPLERSFGWHRTAISASLSFMAIGSLTSPFIGRMMDRHGARPVMVACLSIFGLSFVLRTLMTELWHLYVLSVVQFAGFSGSSMLPAGRLVGIWFPRSRGRVMGISLMGNNFGGLAVPLVVGLVLTGGSWQWAYLVIGVIAFALALVALTFVHERPEHLEPKPGGFAGARAEDRIALEGWTVREALRSQGFWAITFVVTVASFTYSAVLPHVNAHLTDIGLSRAVVLSAVALLATLGMVGKLAFGYLAERITARRAMMVSLGGQIVFIVLMVRYPFLPMVWVSVPFYGFCMGAYSVVVTLLVQESFGLRNYGSIFGLLSMPTVFSMVAGPLLAGASFDITGSYGTAFVIGAGMFGLGILMLTRVPPPVYSVAGQPRATRRSRSQGSPGSPGSGETPSA